MKRKEKPAFLERINAELEKNLENENYDITTLCEALYLSRMHLHRKLKDKTGLSTSQYVRAYKLQRAKELMKDSDLSISEVAYRVGFKSASYFTQMFVKEFGMSPTEFKRR
ncbi:MAG: AraC family transcriptional regulator [Bacteroidota bacterium]